MLRARVGPHEVAYVDMGPRGAPPVVLLHGFVISHRYMLPLARELAPRFRVLLPDMPGFGRSSKPRETLDIDGLANAVAAWVEALALPRAHVVGNSMGCQVGAALAQRHPETVARLALIGPTVDAGARSALRQVGRLALDLTRERASLPFLHAPDYVRAGIPRALRTARHALGDALEERAPDVAAPTLVLRGDRDALVPEPFARALAARFPRGAFARIARAPHAANYSAPERTAALLLPFLLGEEPPRVPVETAMAAARRIPSNDASGSTP